MKTYYNDCGDGKIVNCKCETEREGKRKKWFIFLLLLFLILLILVIIRIKTPDNLSHNITNGIGFILGPHTTDNSSSDDTAAEQENVAIFGHGVIKIQADEKEAEVDFYNPKENKGKYYLKFELKIYNDSIKNYETIYTSTLVEPGKCVKKVMLTHKLKKGIYRAVVHVQPYKMDKDKTLTNNADMRVKVIVE